MTPHLTRLIEEAMKIKMTPDQVRAQKVSFIYGQLGGKLTKKRISNILDRQ